MMNKKGMEMWIMVSLILGLLILLFAIFFISKSAKESGNILTQIFDFLMS